MTRRPSAPPRHARARGGDEGITLVELLVTMVLTTIVLAAVSTVFVGVTRSLHETSVRTGTTADARIAMEAVTRTLRTAVAPAGQDSALVSATDDSVTFYSSLQRGAVSATTTAPTGAATAPTVRVSLQPPTQVTYAWDAAAACLRETQVPGTPNPGTDAATRPWVWTGAGTTKCLARTTQPTAPTFSYFPTGSLSTGSPATAVAPMPVPASGGLVTDDRKLVRSIGVTLTVTDPSDPSVHPSVLTDRVLLTNVQTPGGS